MSPRVVFLIGYMASGKTTLGRAVSEASGVRFVDLDEYIERQAGMTVTDIFATRGEAAFRALETSALRALAASPEPLVVACGGGTPCFGANMELMNSLGLTVYLDASEEVIFSRLTTERSRRPLVAHLSGNDLRSFISASLAERMPFYSKAASCFSTDCLDNPALIPAAARDFIDRYL